jgi:hypothetical protein
MAGDFHCRVCFPSLCFALFAFCSIQTTISYKNRKLEHFISYTRVLLDSYSTDCRHMVLSERITAGVLSPRDLYASSDENVTLVGCVKGLSIPTNGSAFLHVVDGETLTGTNPVPFIKESCSIVWQDVPLGSYEVFVQVLDKNHRELARSASVRFSRIAGPISKRPAKGQKNVSQSPERIPFQRFNHEPDSEEWPIFSKLQEVTSQPKHKFCGLTGWEEVSVHEVISVFLQSEWYKEEHAEWRDNPRVHTAVMWPNISDGNENVLRSMLLTTPRKVSLILCYTYQVRHIKSILFYCAQIASISTTQMIPASSSNRLILAIKYFNSLQVRMLRALPLDIQWYRVTVQPFDLARMHVMCEQVSLSLLPLCLDSEAPVFGFSSKELAVTSATVWSDRFLPPSLSPSPLHHPPPPPTTHPSPTPAMADLG